MAVTAASKVEGRTVEGVCVPYNETSYLTQNPAGELVRPGAFAGALGKGDVFLFRGHDHRHPIGRAVSFTDTPAGLVGTFVVREGELGDEVLRDIAEGYLPAMSVGFQPIEMHRGPGGETVITRARLREVSLLPIGAYEGAKVLQLRAAQQAGAGFRPPVATVRFVTPQPTASAMPMRWHVPEHLRGLVDAEPTAQRGPYAAPGPAVRPEALPMAWHVPDHLRGLVGP
jgi:HK97 family phage prohead protease